MANAKAVLGDMNRVEARTIWAHEEHDFTPWLYGHLDKLGEALGLELEAAEREGDVGDFAVDIVARDLSTNRIVVIENQLAPTDHSHLGQLLTYAAGREAGVVVWISPEFRDEHREALDWLNREGGEGRPEFFGVLLEVLQIDTSKPAVNFRPVAFPNDWTRTINQRAAGEVWEKGLRYPPFFQSLIDALRERKFSGAKKAGPRSYCSFSSGVSGYTYAACFGDGRVRAEIYLNLPDTIKNKAAFQRLFDQKDVIEAEFGEPLSWEKLEDRRACRIAIYRDGTIDDAPDKLDAYRSWLEDRLIKLEKVFNPRIRRG
jgi:hypothetical protein